MFRGFAALKLLRLFHSCVSPQKRACSQAKESLKILSQGALYIYMKLEQKAAIKSIITGKDVAIFLTGVSF